jgi:dGTPase
LEEEERKAVPLVAATCGLIHDLGNPPFGHAGELAIQTWFEDRIRESPEFLEGLNPQQASDFRKFEGNAHSLRIISNLCLLIDDYGLNYTCGTFSAARKYLPPSNKADDKDLNHANTKPGFFWSERDIISIAEAKTGTSECRHPLAFLVEAADDLVYCVVDLEDGIKQRVLDWHLLSDYLRQKCSGSSAYEKIMKAVDGADMTGFSRSERDEALIQLFRISAISEFAIAAKELFSKRYESIMSGKYEKELLLDEESEARPLIEACKDYARANLYKAPKILKLEIQGRRVLHELMDLLWEGVKDVSADKPPSGTKKYPDKIYQLISDNYRRVFLKRLKLDPSNEKYHKLQLVTDYVAGMTDTFACRLHKDLTNE